MSSDLIWTVSGYCSTGWLRREDLRSYGREVKSDLDARDFGILGGGLARRFVCTRCSFRFYNTCSHESEEDCGHPGYGKHADDSLNVAGGGQLGRMLTHPRRSPRYSLAHPRFRSIYTRQTDSPCWPFHISHRRALHFRITYPTTSRCMATY